MPDRTATPERLEARVLRIRSDHLRAEHARGGIPAAVQTGMSKTSAKANRVNQDQGERNRGSEPGQDQLTTRKDRQNTGKGPGTRAKSQNQGRQRGAGQQSSANREKGDSRRAKGS